MMSKANSRHLSDGEISAIEMIILSSEIENSKNLIDYAKSAMVSPINDDGSIVRFCIDGEILEGFHQGALMPTGLVKDSRGRFFEVLLFIDKKGLLTEFEIVPCDEGTLEDIEWNTFELGDYNESKFPTPLQ